MNRLQIKLDNDSVYSDYSEELKDFIIDSVKIKYSNATDKLYVGFEKPFYYTYVDFISLGILEATLTATYYNGSTDVALPSMLDETKGMTRAGFIRWAFDDNTDVTSQWSKQTIDGQELYWVTMSLDEDLYASIISSSKTGNTETVIQLTDEDVALYSEGQEVYAKQDGSYQSVISVDATPGAASITINPGTSIAIDNVDLHGLVELNGFNIVFATDNDLREEYRDIDSFRRDADTNFIALHQSTKKDIVQSIRNKGNLKRAENTDHLLLITEWDFLDIDEIRRASTYWALHKVFNNASDSIDGKWFQLSKYYERKAQDAIEVFILTLDNNNDGQVSAGEQKVSHIRMNYV